VHRELAGVAIEDDGVVAVGSVVADDQPGFVRRGTGRERHREGVIQQVEPGVGERLLRDWRTDAFHTHDVPITTKPRPCPQENSDELALRSTPNLAQQIPSGQLVAQSARRRFEGCS
jgi:hypothetical protein